MGNHFTKISQIIFKEKKLVKLLKIQAYVSFSLFFDFICNLKNESSSLNFFKKIEELDIQEFLGILLGKSKYYCSSISVIC